MAKSPKEQYRLFHADEARGDGALNKAVSPLDVLLQSMRRKWDKGDFDGAAALARVAAPYLHARISTTRPSAGLRTMTDAEIDGMCDTGDVGGSAGAGATAGDTGTID